MNNNTVLSIVGCAIRSEMYERFYESMCRSCDIPFEVVFSGNRPPYKKMPSNFRYIYATVKPVQCVEIAIRHSLGEFVLFSGDDLVYPYGYFGSLVNHLRKTQFDKIIIGSRYKFAHTIRDSSLIFDSSIPSSPKIGFGVCIKRSLLHEIGGIDSKLIGSLYDLDIQMRLFEKGFSLVIPEDLIVEEDNHSIKPYGGRCYAICWRHDRNIVNSCWVKKDKTVSTTRLFPPIPFIDDGILERSQGDNIKFCRWK